MALETKSRNTQQHRVILDHLRSVTSHPTAEAIHEAVVETLPRISLATVYRNLGKLVQRGEIQVIEHAGGQRRYDGNPVNHVHGKCYECGRVVDVNTDQKVLDELQRFVETAECDMEVGDYQLHLIGRCSKCFTTP